MKKISILVLAFLSVLTVKGQFTENPSGTLVTTDMVNIKSGILNVIRDSDNWGRIYSKHVDSPANQPLQLNYYGSGSTVVGNGGGDLQVKHHLYVNKSVRIDERISILNWYNSQVGHNHSSFVMNGERVNGQWELFSDGARSSIGLITTDIFGNMRFITHHDPTSPNGATLTDEVLINNNTKMYISSGGNIGIGISNPQHTLHVDHGSSGEIRSSVGDHFARIGSNGAGGALGASDGNGDLKVNIRGYGDTYFNAGKVGIGTESPQRKLHVVDNNHGEVMRLESNTSSSQLMLMATKTGGNNWSIMSTADGASLGAGKFSIYGTSQHRFVIDQSGNVGIGKTDPQNKLSVNGAIWAKEVKVSLTDAADWVFEEDYNLRSLEEVESFVKENKHLPEVPSADEFRQKDLNVAEMDNKLLQKIEELTLYLIEQNKLNQSQQKQLEEQAALIEELKTEISSLKKD